MRATLDPSKVLAAKPSCCGEAGARAASAGDLKRVALVGNPNVGKSVLFNDLTGLYATVSNYPGTTVEVTTGTALIGTECEILDTPGMYSLFPITEEERVARRILLNTAPELVVHVVDAKNLGRMLPLTLQLLEAGLPVVLVLNMMDEAENEGVAIDIPLLERELGIPVVATVSTTGRGVDTLKDAMRVRMEDPKEETEFRVEYPPDIEESIARLEPQLGGHHAISERAVALFLLQGDAEIRELIPDLPPFQNDPRSQAAYRIAVAQGERAGRIADKVVSFDEKKAPFSERLSRWMMKPLTGLPILFLVLYLGLYEFVGRFGAGTVVGFLEGTVFQGYINPALVRLFESTVPWPVVRDLFVGEYGVLTLGVRYAFALILPIVIFFFVVFSIIEDSGYLPRLAMLIDRTFKKIGLSGRAVIPMVLGFGCDTMATMVTRTLPTVRERVIATMLLALAVPCSAQLGVILALLQGKPAVLLIWMFVLVGVFLFVGYLGGKILPGEPPSFYMELPRLRWPSLSNIFNKTYLRVKWYLKEIMPVFICASVLIWLGQLTHLFDAVLGLLRTPVHWLNLPPECAKIFLLGFFRRDYGAAGLYDLGQQGALNNAQLAVACVALSLFLPCIAQFVMNVKERGWKIGLAISAFVLFFSFGVSYVLSVALNLTGVLL